MDRALLQSSNDGERSKLLNIFPTEIWHRVAKKFADPATLFCANNASLHLRNILLPYRTVFLLPQVFPLLAKHIHWEKAVDIQQFPISPATKHTFKDWKHKILQCRLVCREWKCAVDNFYYLQDTKYFWNLEVSKEFRDAYDKTMLWTRERFHALFADRDKILKFVRHFNETHKGANGDKACAIFSRCLTIFLDHMDGQQDEFPMTLWPALDICGAGLWELNLVLDEFFTVDYKLVKRILSKVPNLKKLHIESDFACSSGEMEQLILSDPPQSFTHLEKLTFSDKLPPAFINKLVSQNRHVTDLDLTSTDFGGECAVFTEVPLPNLKDIYVEFKKAEHFYLVKDISISWPVLTNFESAFVSRTANWNTIFQIIMAKWGNTLTSLTLNLPIRSNPKTKIEPLKLPKLKSLTFTLKEYVPLDFLLPLSSTLEKLSLEISSSRQKRNFAEKLEEAKRNEEIIKCWQYVDKPLESNIWRELPNLKDFYYTGAVNPDTSEYGWHIKNGKIEIKNVG